MGRLGWHLGDPDSVVGMNLIRPVVEVKARSNHDAPGLRLPTLPHTGLRTAPDRQAG